jgi:hypothetical protein
MPTQIRISALRSILVRYSGSADSSQNQSRSHGVAHSHVCGVPLFSALQLLNRGSRQFSPTLDIWEFRASLRAASCRDNETCPDCEHLWYRRSSLREGWSKPYGAQRRSLPLSAVTWTERGNFIADDFPTLLPDVAELGASAVSGALPSAFVAYLRAPLSPCRWYICGFHNLVVKV